MEDYEKKYKNALAWAKAVYNGETGFARDEVEDVFPELKESEEEKIRKHLIKHFWNKSKEDWNGVPVKRILAWLEKQGEHAKFINGIQVGDKVTRNEDGVLVNLSQLNRVAKKQGEQKFNNTDFSDLRTWKYIVDYVVTKWCGIGQYLDNPRLTTIAEELQKKYYLEQKQGEQKAICRNNDTTIDNELNNYCCKIYNALHKENGGELSFARLQSMAMDIYQWCNEQKQGEHKPAWSEEDDVNLVRAQAFIKNTSLKDVDEIKESVLTWITSLKGRVQPQSQWKPSDAQMNAIKDSIDYLGRDTKIVRKHLMSLYQDLKKLMEE